MKILIIEDEKDIATFIKSCLESADFVVEYTESGEHGSFQARVNNYDLIILDLNLPDRNGFEVCRDIRLDGIKIPILILTVESEIESKVQLLNAGADDYLTKPFSTTELIARINALLRRPINIREDNIIFDDFEFNKSKHSVVKGNNEIYLTRKEYILLDYLITKRGQIVSRGDLVDHVWDKEANLFSNTIETHILNLRKKISSKKNKSIIKTYPGRGYGIL